MAERQRAIFGYHSGVVVQESIEMRFSLFLVGVLLCAPGFADEIDLNINSDAARLTYKHALKSSDLQVGAGWLHDQDNGDVFHIDLNLVSEASEGNTPVKAGLGGRIAYFDGELDNQSGTALGIGGFARYTLPRYNRISLGGHFYYAPGVLSFGDGEQLIDSEVRVSYNILRQADVYLGARYVQGEYDNAPDAKLDSGLHIGINMRF